MALFGWCIVALICFVFSLKALFWLWWATHMGSTRGENIFLLVCIGILGYCWYKLFGWFPYELSAKPV